MRKNPLYLIAALLSGLTAVIASAQEPKTLDVPPLRGIGDGPSLRLGGGPTNDKLKVSTAWSASGVHPGGQITLAILLDIAESWHINAPNTPSPFIPTRIEFVNPPDVLRMSTPTWPPSHPLTVPGIGDLPVYSNRATVYVPMAVDAAAEPSELTLRIKVSWQACEDSGVCLPETSLLHTVGLNVVDPSQPISATDAQAFDGFDPAMSGERLNIPFFGLDFDIDPTALWVLLPLAAIGGFLLNLTPCVLPLVPIKIMGLSQAAGNRQRCLLLGLMMSAGVVAFWLGLGAAISITTAMAAKGLGGGIQSTNELFQYPAFTISVGVIIAVMAVGMCGLFAVRLPQWIYRINPSHDTVVGSFGFGIMTAVLSTPCTAPFMGAAAAWAATQHAGITLTTFAAIGAGMALPYLVLSAFPQLVNRMPRTGPASELIKQVMGLLMLAAAAYFIGTGLSGLMVDPPDPPSRAYWWVVGLLIAAAGGWLALRTIALTPSIARRVIFAGLGVFLIAAAGHIAFHFTRSGPINWIYYTPQRYEQAAAAKKIIVMEFTAEWCLNCHALEQTVLHNPQVVKLLNRPDVAPIKVDITGNNEAGNQKLIEVGRRTIPLLIVYNADGREVFKSDAYTVGQVVEAIEQATGAASSVAAGEAR